MGISLFASDNGSDETALVNPDDSENEYRILNGDFREEYKKLAPKGFNACLDFYNKEKKQHKSTWSSGD